MKQPTLEAIKEVGRLVFFAAIGAVIAYLMSAIGNWHLSPFYVLIFTSLLRAADRWVHTNSNVNANGLSPF